MKAISKTRNYSLAFIGVLLMITWSCKKKDDNSNNPGITGMNNASGTYTWNSATSVITINWTNSTFKCGGGPDIGTQTLTGVIITSTTLTFNDNNNMAFTRSGGTAGDIIGKWTATDTSTGNLYALTFNSNGTVSLVVNMTVNMCFFTSSQHWPDGYTVELGYEDQNKSATAVSVTGPGITGSMALTYDINNGQWDSWTYPSTNINFGTSHPTPPLTYTFSIKDGTGTWTATSKVACFQDVFATNLLPTGTVTGTPTFSWTGINDVNALYRIELNDNNYNRIWNSQDISGTYFLYSGPALSSGTTYFYYVIITHSSSCNEGSFAQGSFTMQ